MVKNITDAEFSQSIAEGVTVVDFWAPWCGPCKMIAPVLEQLSEEYGDSVNIVKLNVDEQQQTAQQFGVMSIPTLIIFKDGQEVGKQVGFVPKEKLAQLINQYL